MIPLGEPNLYRLGYGDRLNRAADLRAEVPEAEVRERCGDEALAGDAAHTHFPAGGQGLDLGGKLAAELAGRAPAGLLDSYETERRAVANGMLQNVAARAWSRAWTSATGPTRPARPTALASRTFHWATAS